MEEEDRGWRMTAERTTASPLRAPRWRRRMLVTSEIMALVAAVITLLAVQQPGPFRMGLFLVVAQPAIILGVMLYLIVAVSEFLGSRGVTRLHFDAGETIFREGDLGDCMYAVIEGEVEVVHEPENGERTRIALLGPGQYFGEMAVLRAGPRMATVRAITPVEVAAMGRIEFTALYAYLPDFHKSIEDVVRRRSSASGR
jgi:hypothetical protein